MVRIISIFADVKDKANYYENIKENSYNTDYRCVYLCL